MNQTRRGFLRDLGLLVGAGTIAPVADLLIIEPRRKSWAVGAQLSEGGIVLPPPSPVHQFQAFGFEIVVGPEIVLDDVQRQAFQEFLRREEKLIRDHRDRDDVRFLARYP